MPRPAFKMEYPPGSVDKYPNMFADMLRNPNMTTWNGHVDHERLARLGRQGASRPHLTSSRSLGTLQAIQGGGARTELGAENITPIPRTPPSTRKGQQACFKRQMLERLGADFDAQISSKLESQKPSYVDNMVQHSSAPRPGKQKARAASASDLEERPREDTAPHRSVDGHYGKTRWQQESASPPACMCDRGWTSHDGSHIRAMPPRAVRGSFHRGMGLTIG